MSRRWKVIIERPELGEVGTFMKKYGRLPKLGTGINVRGGGRILPGKHIITSVNERRTTLVVRHRSEVEVRG